MHEVILYLQDTVKLVINLSLQNKVYLTTGHCGNKLNKSSDLFRSDKHPIHI